VVYGEEELCIKRVVDIRLWLLQAPQGRSHPNMCAQRGSCAPLSQRGRKASRETPHHKVSLSHHHSGSNSR
jgi:hypothetical protein